MRPCSGALWLTSLFIGGFIVLSSQGSWRTIPVSCLIIVAFFLSFPLVRHWAYKCTLILDSQQTFESALRSGHTKCRLYAENIGFHGGESSERVVLDSHVDDAAGKL